MNPSQIPDALAALLSVGQPAFIWGPPGVGKSQVVKQTAAALNLELTDIRAVLLDPVDLRGLPRICPDGLSQWCAPAFLPRTGRGVLFLDELNAAPPLVQAACYQLVLDRRLGEYELPEGWSIVAAGNREQDRAVSHRMPSALANRFVHIDFEVDADQWLTWAAARNLAPELIAFIRFRPGLLHDFDPKTETKAFPSPRSWEFVSRLLNQRQNAHPPIPEEVFKDLAAGAVGPGAGAEFCGFLDVWNHLPRVESVVSDPLGVEIPKDPAVLYALCEMLGAALTPANSGPIMEWALRLPPEFSVLLMREAVRRDTAVVNTPAFVQWAEANAEVLV